MKAWSLAGALMSVVCASGTANAKPVIYYGGPVVTNAVVIEVNWGTGVDATLTSTLPAFYTQILQSPYVDWLGEYDTVGKVGATDNQPGSNQRIYPGSFGGAFTITPSITGSTITFAQVASEVTTQVQNKNLPAPTFDASGIANTIYAIDFPKGITIKDAQGNASCQIFCAAFANTQISNATVPIMILPDTGTGTACAGGCGTGTDIQNATQWHSFLLLDVMTDQQLPSQGNSIGRPVAWYENTSGSIADQCSTGVIAGYTVAKGWSNRLNNCVVSDPNLPLCTGSNRPCRACTSSDCSGATPACDTTPGNAHQTQCVACTKDADCKTPTPVCDRATDTCVAAPPVDAGIDASLPDATTTNDAGGDAGTQPESGGGCSCDVAAKRESSGWFGVALAALALFARRRVTARRTSS